MCVDGPEERTANRTKRSLRDDERGAVLVEFLVALMPLLITFSSSVQLMQIVTARLVVKHAAVVGARGAAVISNSKQNTPDQKLGDNKDIVRDGVLNALGPWIRTMATVEVTIDDQSSCDDPYGMVTVEVKANYRCSVPFGSTLVCGGGKHSIREKMSYPHQGARYQDTGGAKCE